MSLPISRWSIDAIVVLVQDLDGILDRDDVHRLRLVDVVDHGGQRRGLARARRAGDEDQPAVLVRDRAHGIGQPISCERGTAEAELAQDHADRPALAEHVDAEPPDRGHRVGEVDLTGGLELSQRGSSGMMPAAIVSVSIVGQRSRGDPLRARGASGSWGAEPTLTCRSEPSLSMQLGQPPVELLDDGRRRSLHPPLLRARSASDRAAIAAAGSCAIHRRARGTQLEFRMRKRPDGASGAPRDQATVGVALGRGLEVRQGHRRAGGARACPPAGPGGPRRRGRGAPRGGRGTGRRAS